MKMVTVYQNSENDVDVYIEAPTGYKTSGKVCLFKENNP